MTGVNCNRYECAYNGTKGRCCAESIRLRCESREMFKCDHYIKRKMTEGEEMMVTLRRAVNDE